MTKCALTVLVAGLLLAADAKKDGAIKDQEALQGAWKVAAVERGGKAEQDPGQFVMAFTKDTFTVRKGEEVLVGGTFTLDPSKSPKLIDMTITEAKKEQDKGKEVHGIYELGRDSLKWCSAAPGQKERPKEFSTKAGSQDMLVTFNKDKP